MYSKEFDAFLDKLVELPSVQQLQQDGLKLLEQALAARDFVVGQQEPWFYGELDAAGLVSGRRGEVRVHDPATQSDLRVISEIYVRGTETSGGSEFGLFHFWRVTRLAAELSGPSLVWATHTSRVGVCRMMVRDIEPENASGLLDQFDHWFRVPEAVISQEYANDLVDRLVGKLAR